MTRTCFAILATIIATSAHADDGIFNQSGWSDGGEGDGVKYFHNDNGENGWQSRIGNNVYYHGSHGNCTTNVGAISQTSCIPY